MNRRRPSRIALIAAAAVVFVVLAALVALPLYVTAAIDRDRNDVQTIALPARDDLNKVNEQLSREIASLARYAVTRSAQQVAEYRHAVALQDQAMRNLRTHVRVLGTEGTARFATLEAETNRWHAGVESYLETTQLNMVAYQVDYPSVVEAVSRLDEAISDYQSARRDEVADAIRLHTRISIILVVLALAAAIVVGWLVARMRTLTEVLAQESDERLAAVRSRDEILGIVSHDLRSPLTTVMLSTQLLEGSPPEEQKEHVDTILSTTRRMERLIQDLLDITKMESAALSIRQDHIDASELAREVVAGHAPIAAEKKIRFEPSIASPLPEIRGDHDRLVQALGNLIGNAFKFTPEGGTVRFIAERRDDRVRFSVVDSGPGIAPGDVPHLFEPFWQAKKTAHLGAGLGLKITRAIIEAHGGSIRVVNEPRGGACFSFDLPAAGRAVLVVP